MTFNQVIKRIKGIVAAHGQLRNFYLGNVSEFLQKKDTQYPSCFLQDVPGLIDGSAKITSYNFRMFLLDLANTSEDTDENVIDVQSDMISVAQDLIAAFDDQIYEDWKISPTSPMALVRDDEPDVLAGVVVDITIETLFIKDTCAIPTT